MLAIAKKYQDTCLFAFKPHPLLRDKLYRQSTWGVARTDTYFQQWEALPNTIIEEGAYSALFCHSDAMIHDSCSFIADYMYTNNPVMFLANDRKYIESTLNSYGLECFNLHYHGDSTNDIMNFIERIVIAGNDPLKTKRSSMVEETFAGAKISVAEKMKLEIDQLL
jgi:CDP-glycerol glycerophosphotransferase (TagB/SpsB family)